MKARSGLLALVALFCLSALSATLGGCAAKQVEPAHKQVKQQKKDK